MAKAKGTIVLMGVGFIGRMLVLALLEAGYRVLAVTNTSSQEEELREGLNSWREKLRVVSFNFLFDRDENESSLLDLRKSIGWRLKDIVGLACTVGHCPPGGFDEAVETPILDLDPRVIEEGIDTHFWPLRAMLREFLPLLADGGRVVVLNSAITQFNDVAVGLPPDLHSFHHVGAMALQQALVQGLRIDPEVVQRDIRVTLVKPGAIDSPFFDGAEHQPPTAFIPAKDVVVALVKALEPGAESAIKFIVPS